MCLFTYLFLRQGSTVAQGSYTPHVFKAGLELFEFLIFLPTPPKCPSCKYLSPHSQIPVPDSWLANTFQVAGQGDWRGKGGVLEESWQIWALPHTHTKFISPSSYAKHIHMCDVGLPVDGVCFTATAPHSPGSLLPKAKGIRFKMSFWNLGLLRFSYLKIFCFLFISSVFTF